MSAILTERQKSDLNHAILDYLSTQSDTFSKSIEMFKQEANIIDIDPLNKGLLAKKWTSVVRLQKKVMELEAKIENLQQNRTLNLSNNNIEDSFKSSNNINNESISAVTSRLLPKPPAKHCLTGHRLSVTTIVTHPTYSLIASGSEDCTIRFWDHETANYERTLKGHTGPITGLCFDSKGLLLASCSSDMSTKIWEVSNTYTCIKTLKGHDHTVSAVVFVHSDEQLVTCSRDLSIKLWEVLTGYCVRTLTGHTDWIKCMSISMDSLYLASGSADHTIIIWEILSGKIIHTLRGHEHVVETVSYGKKPIDAATIIALDGSPMRGSSESQYEYSYLATGSRDRSIKLWNSLKGICLQTFACHDNWVRCVLIHPSGKYIISCSDDKSIKVIDIKDNKCIRSISDAHNHFITSICYSKNYPVLISSSVDKNICVWNCS